MSATDKLKNATESATGNAKEKVGDATGNEDLKAEGQVDQTSADAKQAGAWCYGAEGGPNATPYDKAGFEGAVVLVMGAEGKGLRPRVRKSCDVLVGLPLHGQLESLNVSAAAAVLLYEAARTRAS